MEILSNGVVEISNRDLEPLTKGQQYAKLKPQVIERLVPTRRDKGTLHLAVLRVRNRTRSFQLPEDCVLLALEGDATVAAPGRGCAIWYCENLSLKASVAILGAGRLRQLHCEVVSLVPIQELRVLLPGVSPHRLIIQEGHVDYMFLAHDHSESLPDSPNRMGAEIMRSGNIEDLRIGTIDSAIARLGNLWVQREVYLEEWLREELHELLWESPQEKHSGRINALLGNLGYSERYGGSAIRYLNLGWRRPS
jgi:hypothetical protein